MHYCQLGNINNKQSIYDQLIKFNCRNLRLDVWGSIAYEIHNRV
jgi:hypothetical protein